MTSLPAAALVLALVASGASGAQNKPRDIGKLRQTLQIALDVKEGGGDFTDWVREASIENGALVRQFRWKTSLAGAAGARFEVVHGSFPSSPAISTPINLKLDGYLKLPQQAGAHGIFSIDFTPVLQASVGTSKPPEPVTFHVRIVPLDKQNQPLATASTPVKITYAPPADGTIFSGASMVVRLQTVKCITVTDGLGDDELDITVIARPLDGAAATVLYWENWDIDDGEEVHPSKTLWTYQGLSFEPAVQFVVVLQEDDAGGAFQAGIRPPGNDAAFDSLLLAMACTGDHDCIGLPQKLSVTAADWRAVAVGRRTVIRTLTFKGLGGHYEATFQLAPK